MPNEDVTCNELSEADLNFIVRSFDGDIWAAKDYCARIAQVKGPLSGEYRSAERRLTRRLIQAAKFQRED